MNIFLPSSDGHWMETNNGYHGNMLDEGMADDRRKWGSSSAHAGMHASGRW